MEGRFTSLRSGPSYGDADRMGHFAPFRCIGFQPESQPIWHSTQRAGDGRGAKLKTAGDYREPGRSADLLSEFVCRGNSKHQSLVSDHGEESNPCRESKFS